MGRQSFSRLLTFMVVLLAAIYLASSCSLESETVVRSELPARNNLLICSSAGRLFTFDLDTHGYKEIKVKTGTGAAGPLWSPDRRTIAYVGGKLVGEGEDKHFDIKSEALWLMGADGKRSTELAPGWADSGTGHNSWSPNGSYLFINSQLYAVGEKSAFGDFVRVDMRGKITEVQQRRRTGPSGQGLMPTTFSISPDGNSIAMPGENRDAFEVFEFNGKSIGRLLASFKLSKFPEVEGFSRIRLYWVQPVWTAPEELVLADDEIRLLPRCLPDGTARLAPTVYRYRLWKWNIQTGKRKLILQSEPLETFTDLTASPSKKAVAFLCATTKPTTGNGENPYEPGKEPRPAVVDLASGRITRYNVQPGNGLWPIDLNWAAP